jgi:hypothetical protein
MIFQPVQQSLGAEICGKNNVIFTAQFGNGKFIPPIKMVMTGWTAYDLVLTTLEDYMGNGKVM